MSERRRITKVTTRAGDQGMTKLATGRSVAKHEPIMRAIGAVDELNSQLGMLEAHADATVAARLRDIQQHLFDIGAVFAMEGSFDCPEVDDLESWTESINAELPPLTEFVLPRGGVAASQAHICRTVCRRAEQTVWHLIDTLTEAPQSYTEVGRYLNRLSDLLFVLARQLGLANEQQWQGPNKA